MDYGEERRDTIVVQGKKPQEEVVGVAEGGEREIEYSLHLYLSSLRMMNKRSHSDHQQILPVRDDGRE